MKPIKLSVLADAFEEAMEEWGQYLNTDSGEIIAVPERYGIAEEYYDYRHAAFVEYAKDWCQGMGIEFVKG